MKKHLLVEFSTLVLFSVLAMPAQAADNTTFDTDRPNSSTPSNCQPEMTNGATFLPHETTGNNGQCEMCRWKCAEPRTREENCGEIRRWV